MTQEERYRQLAEKLAIENHELRQCLKQRPLQCGLAAEETRRAFAALTRREATDAATAKKPRKKQELVPAELFFGWQGGTDRVVNILGAFTEGCFDCSIDLAADDEAIYVDRRTGIAYTVEFGEEPTVDEIDELMLEWE